MPLLLPPQGAGLRTRHHGCIRRWCAAVPSIRARPDSMLRRPRPEFHLLRAATLDAPVEKDPAHLEAERIQQLAGAELVRGTPNDASAEQEVVEATSSDSEDSERPGSSKAEDEEFPTLQLILPEPTHSRVKTATFIKSSTKLPECPPVKFPEFAVIGRSNVGKSSLINMVTGSKNLALVSKEPGKTRCINHFLINSNWYLVDLPGYGYARTAKTMRAEFDQFTTEYFQKRTSLAMVFLLVDSSIPPQKVDLEYAQRLADFGTPFCIVFTKADKRKKGAPPNRKNRIAFKHELLKTFELLPPSVVTSADTGLGKSQLQALIASLRVAYEQSHK